MVLSYILVGTLFRTLVLSPQKDIINKYKREKVQIEYDYMKMTSSPAFLNSINAAIREALIQKNNFEWVDTDPEADSSLVFYNYIFLVAKRNQLYLYETNLLDSDTKKRGRSHYYSWRVKLTGPYNNLLKFIEELEFGDNFLIIEDISIIEGGSKNIEPVYDLKILCLKKGDNETDSKTSK
jgi:hypothetical protein